MATTVSDLQSRIAYRMREKSAPDSVEALRRLQFINEGQRTVIRKHYYWFTEATATFDSVADQESYDSTDGFPSDIRGSAILELRYNGSLYTPMTQTEAFETQDSSYASRSQSYFIFNKSLYPVPKFPASGTDYVTMKYYKLPTTLSASTDELLIPDEYSDIVVAFVVGRLNQLNGKRASASDAYDEFNEILKEMNTEQNNYLMALKSNESDLTAIYE